MSQRPRRDASVFIGKDADDVSVEVPFPRELWAGEQDGDIVLTWWSWREDAWVESEDQDVRLNRADIAMLAVAFPVVVAA